MTQEHPITPPPELVRHLIEDTPLATGAARELHLINAAYCAGADMELEACCEWVSQFDYDDYSYGDRLQAVRRGRPKPPSLKEQALALLDDASDRLDAAHENTIRRALESLPS